MELITGYTQKGVFPEHDADLVAGLVGYNLCVTGVGERMRAELGSANILRIFDGVGLLFGRQFYIKPNEYDEIFIDGISEGMKRSDFITVKYRKDPETGQETMSWGYLRGIDGEEALDPVPDTRDIRLGATESEVPFLRIKYDGQTAVVEKMYNPLPTVAEIVEAFKKTLSIE